MQIGRYDCFLIVKSQRCSELELYEYNSTKLLHTIIIVMILWERACHHH